MAKKSTQEEAYAKRLENLSGVWWKSALDTQRPYRWNLKRLNPGKTLEVGCGIGRLLKSLPAGSVGVDHNSHSIEIAKKNGCTALTAADFKKSKHAEKGSYDSILIPHVIEHMNEKDNIKMLKEYIPFLKKNGKIIVICPQEKGYSTDATHVDFYDFDALEGLLGKVDFGVEKKQSFPFPRIVGRYFPYNEFVVVAKRTAKK